MSANKEDGQLRMTKAPLMASAVLIIALGITALWFRASHPKGSIEREQAGPPITKEQAIADARRDALEVGWKQIEVTSVSFVNGHWEVWYWGLPKRPGSWVGVDVATNGNIIKTHPGE